MKQLPLHALHEAHGAKFVPFAGYEMPVRYRSEIQEHLAVREHVGLFDVSHMGQFLVEGPGALPLLSQVFAGAVRFLKPGQSRYGVMCNEQGGVIDDLIVSCLAPEEYLLVVNAARRVVDWEWISDHNTFDARLTDLSEELALLAVQGPRSFEVLDQVFNGFLSPSVPTFSIQSTKWQGTSLWVSVTGYTGEPGVELLVPTSIAMPLAEAILAAGKPYDMGLCGLAARDTLRLERGYCLYGQDLSEETTPLEAGLNWTVDLSKSFIGQQVLQAQKDEGLTTRLRGLRLLERGIPRPGWEIRTEAGEVIGTLTSGGFGVSLGFGIGMGYLPTEWAKEGTELVVGHGERAFAAQVVRPPF